MDRHHITRIRYTFVVSSGDPYLSCAWEIRLVGLRRHRDKSEMDASNIHFACRYPGFYSHHSTTIILFYSPRIYSYVYSSGEIGIDRISSWSESQRIGI